MMDIEHLSTSELERLLESVDPKEREIVLDELAQRQHPMFVD